MVRNWLLRAISAVRPAPLASVIGHLAGYHHRIVWRGPEGVFWLSPLNDLGRRLILDHSYEPAMVDTLKQFLGPGKTFIDAGANEGYFSVIASRLVGESGHVIAIEPQTRLQEVLQRNLSLNGCRNVTVVRAALAKASGEGRLFLAADVNTGSSSFFRPTRYPLPKEAIRCRTLNQIIEDSDIRCCDLLKLDLEGAEYEVLMSAPATLLRNTIRTIAVEFHDVALAGIRAPRKQVDQRLRDHGFHLVFSGSHSVYHRDPAGDRQFEEVLERFAK